MKIKKIEVLENSVHYYVEDLTEQVIKFILRQKKLKYKNLKLAINQENIPLGNGTKAIGLFYDEGNSLQFKIENFYDGNNFEIKQIDYNSKNEISRIVEYENYPSGEIKHIKELDDEGNILYEESYEEAYWDD